KEITQIYPQSGWVEQDPREIWAAQESVAVEALARAGLAPKDILAVGITNQRETAIVWDRDTGEPVANTIVWHDRRTAPMSNRLRDRGLKPMIPQRTRILVRLAYSGASTA